MGFVLKEFLDKVERLLQAAISLIDDIISVFHSSYQVFHIPTYHLPPTRQVFRWVLLLRSS